MGNDPASGHGRVVPLAEWQTMPAARGPADWPPEVLAHVPEAIAVWGESHRLVQCNAAYRSVLADLADLLEPGARLGDLAQAAAERGLLPPGTNPETWSAERLVPNRPAVNENTWNGRWLRRSVTATPDGLLVEMLIDMTPEHSRELANREAHARLNAIMAALPDLLIQVDVDGRYCAMWSRGTPLAGTDQVDRAGDLIGLRLDEAFDPPLAGCFTAHLSAVRETGRLQMLEYDVDTAAGKRHFEARSVPMDADHTISVIRDVTAEKMRDETLHRHLVELEAAQTQLRHQAEELRTLAARLQAERLRAEEASATKTAFLANMSHELRTPLNAVIGFAELMKNETLGSIGNERYIQYARDIHESGTLLLSLISDILDLSKIEAGSRTIAPQRVDIPHAVASGLRLVDERARQGGIKLFVEVPATCPPIDADERALKQMVVNLLSNAIKFTPPGGTVRLSVEPLDGGARIAVSDTGIGIAAEDLDAIFEPFHQIHAEHPHQPRYPGSGLGLTLVKSLVELHGGRIDVKSRVGEGTTVSLILPSTPPRGDIQPSRFT